MGPRKWFRAATDQPAEPAMPDRKAAKDDPASAGPGDNAELVALRDELDKVKRDLIAAKARVRDLEQSRREALQRLDAVIAEISSQIE